MDDVNEQTEHEIDGVTDLMVALKSVSDVGKRVIDEVAAFADTVLRLAEVQDEMAVAVNDMKRAVEEVTRINAMIEELIETKKKFEEDRAAAQAEYEEKINEMKEQYDQMTEELRNKFREEITLRFDQFKENFKAGRDQYLLSLNNLIDSIHIKSLGLKEHSMNQRAMILTLYSDFCDTQFYHSFTTCTATQTPLMSDDFDLLLKKLNEIQWDTLTSSENLPGRPISFGKPSPYSLTITDSTQTNIKMPVEIFRNNSRVDINLKDYDVYGNFDKFWRIRLDMIRVILLDEFNKPIPSPGSDLGGYIQIRITYPTTFNDTNLNSDKLAFLAQDFFCSADYFTIEDDVEFVSQCVVDDEFTDINYKPAPDGLFSIKLGNPEQLDVQKIQKIKIQFAGNSIPRDMNNIRWIE